jgi:hypothetical protein
VNAAFLNVPPLDPTPIFEALRGNFATEFLAAAVAHLHVFPQIADRPRTFAELCTNLGLQERPGNVLFTALRALGLVTIDTEGLLALTELAREYLVPGRPFDVSDYVRLAADYPGVLALVERLRTNHPANARPDDAGAAYIYREGLPSAMEEDTAARRLTMALSGRARCVAPLLAERYPLQMTGTPVLLDVGGGTGLYSIAYLQRHPGLRAIVWDRPAVLAVATELAAAYGVADRLSCQSGDMFRDPVPAADVVLLSNVLHDWNVPECRTLIRRCAAALPPRGQLLVHDVFLDDDLGGPLAVALYSAALFTLTEGRAYSAAEYRAWLNEAGLQAGAVVSTLSHWGVLPATRPAR